MQPPRFAPLAAAKRFMSTSKKVNQLYQPGVPKAPMPAVQELSPGIGVDNVDEIIKFHAQDFNAHELKDMSDKHALFTWNATSAAAAGAIHVNRSEGIYFYDMTGKKYTDFNSMAMCTNLGYSIPKEIVKGVMWQLENNFYCYPGGFTTPIRTRLCTLLAQICPGDINSFLFPSGGAEANETAVRMARVMTKRHKIMSRYRSYHGATLAAISLTGDQRRWPAEAGSNGFVKFFDPYPYSFSWGETEEEITQNSLNYLRETIAYEGGHTIAAIFLESMTGTNGILKAPKGYLEGVRQICNEHGILMVCDEVMGGFGRTGKVFAFQHSEGVIPDIVCFAKGMNASILPLGGVGVRDHVAEFFRTNAIGIGSTYNGHPVGLASSYYTIQYILKNKVIENVQKMGDVLSREMGVLADKHPSVKQYRNLGLFGCFDIQKNLQGEFICRVADPMPKAMIDFKKDLIDQGLFTMLRGHNVMTNPPLIINEQQIKDSAKILDKSFNILDAAMEK